jgi:hypothetical protein
MNTLKYEEVYRTESRNIADASAAIGEFLKGVYREERLHSVLDYGWPRSLRRYWQRAPSHRRRCFLRGSGGQCSRRLSERNGETPNTFSNLAFAQGCVPENDTCAPRRFCIERICGIQPHACPQSLIGYVRDHLPPLSS